MAILQQQQGVGGPKLSPPPMGGPVPKHPDAHLHPLGMNAHKQSDGPVHAAMGGSELHSKAPAAFTGKASPPQTHESDILDYKACFIGMCCF